MLKKYLLSLGCFIDNGYLDEYLLFIKLPFSFSENESTEKHHIIPRSFYTANYSKKSSKDISLDDPNNYLVKLTCADHFYAHWLLYNCTLSKLKASNAKTLIAMSGREEVLHFSKEAILEIVKEIKRDCDYYWSPTDDSILTTLYNEKVSVEVIAEKLNKTPSATKARISRLQLSDKIWTVEDEIWLISNYNVLGKQKCAEYLNRSELAIEHKVNKLGISTRNWTLTDEQWLIENYSTTPLTECEAVLNRSQNSITSKANALGLSKSTFWTPEEDAWLTQARPAADWATCSQHLGRSISSIKQRAFMLGLPNDYRDKVSKAVRCVETGEIFSSATKACTKYGQGVKHNLQGRHKSVKGLHFEYYKGEL